MYLYLLLNLGSLSIPFIYSFNKKMQFIKQWKTVLLSITVVASFFILWDVFFTAKGIWGFNENYHLPYLIAGLPIEEILFFFCIPYASIFIYYSLEYFKPSMQLSEKITKLITSLLVVILVLVLIFNSNKWYTFVNYIVLIFSLLLGLFFGLQILRRFYIAFLIILIPFFIVNGILTGSFITEPVVWYNNAENLGMRLFTIPIEDVGYAFSMLFLVVFLNEKFKKSKLSPARIKLYSNLLIGF
ncbi:MAG: lycopene cyclase domain-containing protein [Flavobacteriaceae bacterium]|nr:lycopene cyclase domain-containing protein [Flavobacteriaceae bacterium]